MRVFSNLFWAWNCGSCSVSCVFLFVITSTFEERPLDDCGSTVITNNWIELSLLRHLCICRHIRQNRHHGKSKGHPRTGHEGPKGVEV